MDTPFKDEGAAELHTQLRSFSPIFPVRDLRRALAHYASFGFEVTPYADGDYYGFADRDGVGLGGGRLTVGGSQVVSRAPRPGAPAKAHR